MTENPSVMTPEILREDLRRISVFSDLPDDQLTWLAERMVDQRLERGELLARPGDPVRFMTVILEGEIEGRREGDPGPPIFVAGAGQVTGALPYSRLTSFAATVRAVGPTRLLQLHRDQFPELVQRFPLLAQRLVGIMSDRIRETARLDLQREKMAALGKLSAGLAHELNNPAAAAQRASVGLREALETVREASLRLARHSLTQEQRELIAAFEIEAWHQKSAAADPLAQSDREEAIVAWLEQRQVPEAWKLAPVLADSGVDVGRLEVLAAGVGDRALPDALKRSSTLLTVFKLTVEIETSTRRISDLVRAIKEYSYMDQAPLQEVDVHQGIESTLTILGHWLKRGVTVVRDFDPSLPRVCAYGSELNQVWTNLIDNAIGAMHGEGELRIRTARENDCVLVEIGDNGPGIPQEIQPRIFEPFFTTKPVGEGTGLGLDTVYRIVTRHHGDIRVESKPGDTRFRVRLPVTQPRTG
ncbi:MAG TPA: ATP-binding protein [Terriglobia bacterium]|nr:ATP-binding protein [Terriglobia bacterium]